MHVFAYRDWTGAPHLVAGVLLCLGALLLLLAPFGGDSAPGEAARSAAPAPVRPAAALEVRREAVGRRFEVAGASFRVLAHPGAGWASAARAARTPPGTRREVLAVEVVNRSRARFNPGLLSYLLRGPDGALYAPERGGIVGPAGLGYASGLPRGARAVERLVFSVPARLRHPVLALQPSPTRPLEVRVRLGG
jgi:hypothetical protein